MKSINMYDVLASGRESFKIEVPYKLIESGEPNGEKPLFVYLHGFNQNIREFEKLISGIIEIEAYHLLIEAPYPIYDTQGGSKVSDWGRAWYLYDGDQGQFIKSMEISSEFIQHIIDRHLELISVARICIFGYSMGGYLAGYFAMTRWKHVNELILTGCRLKTEILKDEWKIISHMNILALHGLKDDKVKADPQKVEIEKLQKHGVSATFKTINGSHKLSKPFIEEAKRWLISVGYEKLKN
jgi:predicted esterase